MMNIYPVTVERNGERLTVQLKLDVKRIRELTAKTGKDIIDMITDAPKDPGLMAQILDAALRFRNNPNPPDLDGDELFELLVEGGTRGMSAWMRVVNGIGVVSGPLDETQARAMQNSLDRRMKRLLEELEQEDDVPSVLKEGKERPLPLS